MKLDLPYFQHIRDAIESIEEYTSGGRDIFFTDRKTQDAVIRQFEIIGEAIKHVSQDLKSRHPDVSWRTVAGLRDRLIHGYMDVNLDTVWEIAENRLPAFREQVTNILSDLENREK